MKKVYECPRMDVETFTPNTSVAYCTNTYDTTSWEPQTVNCVISSSDNIFGSTNCADLDGYEVVGEGQLIYIEGEGYFFIWANTSAPSQGGNGNNNSGGGFGHSLLTLSGESGLKTILEAAGIGTDNWQKYHAGPVRVTTTTVTKQNWSL